MSKWYDEVNDVIEERDKKCELNGSDSGYVLPRGAFGVKSRTEFEKRFPFDLKNNDHKKFDNCRHIRKLSKADMDEENRYYPSVHTEKACKKTEGIWDKSQPNRATRYGRGTCFTNKQDQSCAIHSVPELVRRDKLNPDKNLIYREAETNCNTDSACTWRNNDCVRVELKDAQIQPDQPKPKSTLIEMPPSDMPQNVTQSDIEQFLYDWYTEGNAPATRDLFGEGDRCNPSKPKTADPLEAPSQIDPYTTLEYKKFIKNWDSVIRSDRTHPDMQTFLEKIGFLDIDYAMRSVRRPVDSKSMTKLKQEIEAEYINYIDHINLSKFRYEDDPVQQEDRKFLPSLPQSVVNMVMKQIALTNSTNRGMMALHSTGSGKTCTAAGVMDAFWDTNRQIIFASSIDAIAANPPFKFHECAMRLFPRFKRLAKSLEQTAQLFKERNVIYLPFAKLANRITKTEKFKALLTKTRTTAKTTGVSQQLVIQAKTHYPSYSEEIVAAALKQANLTKLDDYVDLDNAILIIDEVHNLFRPLPTQREKHRLVEKHVADPKAHPNLKVVILSATPGDNVTDTIKLLNIVRDPTNTEITPPNIDNPDSITKFKESIRGIISYFDMSYDTTQFPTVQEQPLIKLPMSSRQFERYLEAYKEVKDTSKDYNKLAKNNQLAKYWQGPRKYSNMLFNFEKGMQLTEFSSKLPVLLERVQSYPKEKHYVYSAFYEARGSSQGVLEIARQLDNMGYTKLTVKEAKELNKRKALPPPGKRYILALQKEIGEEGSTSAGNNLAEMINIYNHKENRNGELVHLFLATQGFNEGLDLKAVRHIHFFEPLVTMASDLQTIGRARRYCSHADLNRAANEWTVMLHRYIADLPLKASFEDIGLLEQAAQQAKQQVDSLTAKIEALPKRDPQLKSLKAELAEAKKQAKESQSKLKKAEKEDTSKITAIDEFIYNNAQERMRELFTIHQSIKEAAIDCRLLNKFHNAMSPTPYQCVGSVREEKENKKKDPDPEPIQITDIPDLEILIKSREIIDDVTSSVDLSGLEVSKLQDLFKRLQPVLSLAEPGEEMMDYMRNNLVLKTEEFNDLVTNLSICTLFADPKRTRDPIEFANYFRTFFSATRQKHLVIASLILGLLGDWEPLHMRNILTRYRELYDLTSVLIGKRITDKEIATYKRIAQELSRIFSTRFELFQGKYPTGTLTTAWSDIMKRFSHLDDASGSEYVE